MYFFKHNKFCHVDIFLIFFLVIVFDINSNIILKYFYIKLIFLYYFLVIDFSKIFFC